jgi:hypothetical protein
VRTNSDNPRPLDLWTNSAAARAELQGKLHWLHYIKGFQIVAGLFSLSVKADIKSGSGQTVKYTNGRYTRPVKTRISI